MGGFLGKYVSLDRNLFSKNKPESNELGLPSVFIFYSIEPSRMLSWNLDP